MLTFNYDRLPMTLHHDGECGFIGITPDEQLYVEEFFGDERLAQHQIDAAGQIVASVDESVDDEFRLLHLPAGLIRPPTSKASLPLNHLGARYRGLREPERLSDMVQSLTIAEKMALLAKLALKIPPMMLAGIAESRVLSEASLDDAGLYLVCRRVLLAIMLPEQRLDAEGLPYDYETLPLYVAHLYNTGTSSGQELAESLQGIGGVMLARPLECLVHHERLYIAEGGDTSERRRSRVHRWKITRD